MQHFSTLLICLLTGIMIISLPLNLGIAADGQPSDMDAADPNGQPSDMEPENTTWILNPLKVDTIHGLIDMILNWLLMIAIPLSTIVITYAGLLFMFSGGETTKRKKAKDTLLYAVIGITVLLLAKGISYSIASFLTP